MEASLSLRRPTNWQDFETLCKKLWGEIWECPEIKKNGRAGQTQHGVDVYGVPKGEVNYYGIQCKGKDEYTNKQFTEDEITDEIEKAKSFQPSLKKLYFATTAVKDAGIEEFIRVKNLENISKGLFEIHIFSWEDIVDLIDENKQTHDYYLKSQSYKSKQSVSVTFQNGLSEITLIPQFKKTTIHRRQKIVPAAPLNDSLSAIMGLRDKFTFATPTHISAQIMRSNTKTNHSLCPIYFQIHNIGIEALEEFKLLFEIQGEIQEITDDNEVRTGTYISPKIFHTPDVHLNKERKGGRVLPQTNILVGDDTYNSDEFYIKPCAEEYTFSILWKLISKDFKDEGVLQIIVVPNIDFEYKDILVEDPFMVGTTEGGIEDVFTEKED